MNLTKEQIDSVVTSAMPDVLAALRKEFQEQALYTARSTLNDEVRKAVQDWVVTEIIPEIRTALAESKAGIVATVPQLAETLVTVLGTALGEQLKKNLEQSYNRTKIMEALFK